MIGGSVFSYLIEFIMSFPQMEVNYYFLNTIFFFKKKF